MPQPDSPQILSMFIAGFQSQPEPSHPRFSRWDGRASRKTKFLSPAENFSKNFSSRTNIIHILCYYKNGFFTCPEKQHPRTGCQNGMPVGLLQRSAHLWGNSRDPGGLQGGQNLRDGLPACTPGCHAVSSPSPHWTGCRAGQLTGADTDMRLK